MKTNRTILTLLIALAVDRAGAAVANMTVCNQTLAQLTTTVVEAGARAPEVSEFIRATMEKRNRLRGKKAEIEAEIEKLEDQIAEERPTLTGLDWVLDRSIGYPSVTAKPWADQAKALRKHLRKLESEIGEIESTYEPKLFALMAAKAGAKGHYVQRLKDFLTDYAYRIEDVDWVLDSLKQMAEQYARIEATLPESANALTRTQHALKVRMSQRRVNSLKKARMLSILSILTSTKDLAPFSGLGRLSPQIESSADLGRWIGSFESARTTLKTQHDNVFAKYDLMKSLAERVAQ